MCLYWKKGYKKFRTVGRRWNCALRPPSTWWMRGFQRRNPLFSISLDNRKWEYSCLHCRLNSRRMWRLGRWTSRSGRNIGMRGFVRGCCHFPTSRWREVRRRRRFRWWRRTWALLGHHCSPSLRRRRTDWWLEAIPGTVYGLFEVYTLIEGNYLEMFFKKMLLSHFNTHHLL